MNVHAVITGQRKRLSFDRGSKSHGFPGLVTRIWTAARAVPTAPTHWNCRLLHRQQHIAS